MGASQIKSRRHEAHIPAQRTETQAYPRLSGTHGHQERPAGHQSSSCQGSQAAVRLSPGTHDRVPSRGFGKRLRLLDATAYRAVFDNVELKAGSPHLVMLCCHNELGHPRLGLVIAKKHVRLAARRNRLKRLIRESFRQHQHHLPALDIVVLARKGADELDNQAAYRLLDKQWKKLIQRSHQPNPPADSGSC